MQVKSPDQRNFFHNEAWLLFLRPACDGVSGELAFGLSSRWFASWVGQPRKGVTGAPHPVPPYCPRRKGAFFDGVRGAL